MTHSEAGSESYIPSSQMPLIGKSQSTQEKCLMCLFQLCNKVNLLTVRNARSRATRTFVSMLVLFFLRRPGTPSKPREGEDRELGLGRVLSMDMVSDGGINISVSQTVKSFYYLDYVSFICLTFWLKSCNRNFDHFLVS